MSLYAEYIKEREGKDIIETDKGFATYALTSECAYIVDIYVKPDFRKTGEASFMADTIAALAKEHGCTYLLGSVCPQAKGATASLKVLLAYGFQLSKSTETMIYLKKDLK